jgi:hypothetical protein
MSDDRAMMLPQKSLAPDRKPDKHFRASAHLARDFWKSQRKVMFRDQSMIRKSGNRFSDKIMLKQKESDRDAIPLTRIMIRTSQYSAGSSRINRPTSCGWRRGECRLRYGIRTQHRSVRIMTKGVRR